eukprot:TRINITY_DN12150_c0_g6_i1.p1 TRINITY_DN12150_c0_g6~~TRINITY_DN12150_c0_g6_i1.p1  ORF type:complete len:462 (+),score=84.82 TRINITY_DN12150_c0_g6_i1:131-1387(+)
MADAKSNDQQGQKPAKKAKIPRLEKIATDWDEQQPEDNRTGGTGRPEGFVRKAKSRKCVLLMSFQGTNYRGMQRNPDAETIEEELLKALLKVDAIDERHFEKPQAMQFQRCARTDKGVHAARQLVSLKLRQSPSLVESLNTELPPEIRIVDCIRVTKGFNAKAQCTARRYEYLLPSYALCPKEKAPSMEYRVTSDKLELFRSVLERYQGSHKFHNFTSGKSHSDESARRYIMSFEALDPFVRDGAEWLRLQVKGQSFMIHQIRKMIGLAVAITKGHTNLEYLNRCFGSRRADVPKVPGMGLFLDNVYFDRYNKNFKDHEPMEFDKYDEVVEQFKAEYIHSHIIAQEASEKVILDWLATLFLHQYEVELPHDSFANFANQKEMQQAANQAAAAARAAAAAAEGGTGTNAATKTSAADTL